MTKPNRNFHARTHGPSARRAFLPLALIAALFAVLAAAPIATAQDPGYDQYEATPTPPGNDDPAPPENEDPVPASGADSGDTSDDGSTGAVPSTDSGVPPTTEPETVPATTGGGNGDGKKNKNNDDRTLEGFAANAENQRADDGLQTGTQLRSETASDDSSGIGWYIWVALGLIVIWAIAMGVTNFRRRNDDSKGKGASRRSGEQQTA